MKRYGHVTYCLYCNFTNYGSALHTYALNRVVNQLDSGNCEMIVMDYCPDVLMDKDVLNPIKNLWDSDEESRHMVELSLPAIALNYEKFKNFYNRQFKISKKKYTSSNFNDSLEDENLDGYVCGSDTIWCIREFGGFEDGFFANYPVMKNSRSIAYAASFGDVDFTPDELKILRARMKNFKAIGVRENAHLDEIQNFVDAETPIQRVLDPTLLLTGKDYSEITANPISDDPYILMYARRYNKAMEDYVDKMAAQLNCKVVEISLRATNSFKHIMKYDAGVEEFLSLVKNAELVVTNSFHGAIFAIQMHKPFKVFSREQADTKIDELLSLLNLEQCKMVTGEEQEGNLIDYESVEAILKEKRKDSLKYLKEALEIES